VVRDRHLSAQVDSRGEWGAALKGEAHRPQQCVFATAPASTGIIATPLRSRTRCSRWRRTWREWLARELTCRYQLLQRRFESGVLSLDDGCECTFERRTRTGSEEAGQHVATVAWKALAAATRAAESPAGQALLTEKPARIRRRGYTRLSRKLQANFPKGGCRSGGLPPRDELRAEGSAPARSGPRGGPRFRHARAGGRSKQGLDLDPASGFEHSRMTASEAVAESIREQAVAFCEQPMCPDTSPASTRTAARPS
jgi:hypothetical protein